MSSRIWTKFCTLISNKLPKRLPNFVDKYYFLGSCLFSRQSLVSSHKWVTRYQQFVRIPKALAATSKHTFPISDNFGQVFRSRLKTELFAQSYSHDYQRLIALTTITWLHCLGLLLRVLVVLGLKATVKLIRSSSSSSSSSYYVRMHWHHYVHNCTYMG